MTGTSMAAPVVAGIAALYLSTSPTASPATVATAIKNAATNGVVTQAGTDSPNMLAYSAFSVSPTPTPTPATTVTIRKRRQNTTTSSPNVAFPYSATNLASSNFALTDNASYSDPNVVVPSGHTMVMVDEEPVVGWMLTSINCTETSGITNSTIDLANGAVNIVAEPGEQIDCTFTSEPLAPSAAFVSISGRVIDGRGYGIRNAVVNVISSDGSVRTVNTSSFGYFRIEDVEVGATYVVMVAHKRHNFSSLVVAPLDEISDMQIVAIE